MNLDQFYDKHAFVVLEKRRTRIWDQRAVLSNIHPVALYDPTLFPSHNYGNSSDAGLHIPLFSESPTLFGSYLSSHYQERIYKHLLRYQTVSIVGSGYLHWSSINCFKTYLEINHADFPATVEWNHKFRIENLSNRELLRFAHESLSLATPD